MDLTLWEHARADALRLGGPALLAEAVQEGRDAADELFKLLG